MGLFNKRGYRPVGHSHGGRNRWSCSLSQLLATLVCFGSAFAAGLLIRRNGYVDVVDEWVQVDPEGGRLVLGGRPFLFAGFNAQDLPMVARLQPHQYATLRGLAGQALSHLTLGLAARHQLSVVRAWAHTSFTGLPFQTAPGVYSEAAFRGLDHILHQARQHGLRVVLSLVDNWKYAGGVEEYLDWSPTVGPRNSTLPEDDNGNVLLAKLDLDTQARLARRHALFYVDDHARDMYKQHVQAVLTRRNHISRTRYADDSTLMAVNLINEPRCEAWAEMRCPDWLQGWIGEMAAYVRSIAPSTLVTVGSEGFFGEWDGIQLQAVNPAGWAADLGQSFVANNMHVDFATVHLWPDNWNITGRAGFIDMWIRVHERVAREQLKKPLVLEEFGKVIPAGSTKKAPPCHHRPTRTSGFQGMPYGGRPPSCGGKGPHGEAREVTREEIFEEVYSTVENLLDQAGALQGTMFWRLESQAFRDSQPGSYDITTTQPVFRVVRRHTHYVHRLHNSLPPGPGNACWVPVTKLGLQGCVLRPQVCEAAREEVASSMANGNEEGLGTIPLMFTSWRECCQAGLGAFSGGCSKLAALVLA